MSPARRRLRWLLLALPLAACGGGRPPPVPTGVTPASAVEGPAVDLVISGEGFSPRVFTDFETPERARLDATWRALLGSTPLRQVRLLADGTLAAVVPEGLPPGTYDLTVSDPWSGLGVLAFAFRILSADELDEAVVGFRFEEIGAQKAGLPFTVTALAVDARGETVPHFNGVAALTDSTGTAVPETAGHFVLGRWSGTVEIGQAIVENRLTLRDARDREGTSNPFAVAAREPAALRFSSAPQSLLAGACSEAVTVALLDELGFGLAAPRPLEIALSASPEGGLSGFSDAACLQPLAALPLERGETRARFFFRGVRAGQIRLEAGADDLTPAAQLQQVHAAFPVSLAFATSAQTIEAGACSAAVVLESRDASGNAAAVDQDTPVALSTTPSAGFSAFADANCASPINATILAAGRASALLHLRATRAGAVTLLASSTLGEASQELTVVPAAPAALAFVTSEPRVVQGSCSPPAQVEVRDRFGNPSLLRVPVTVSLTAPAGSGVEFFSDACATPIAALAAPAGALRLTFHLRGARPGDFEIRAASPPLDPATQVAHVLPPLPDRLEFVTPARSAVAGECSALLTVQSRDPAGNPRAVAEATAMALSAPAGASLSFFRDSSCAQPAAGLTLLAGEDSASFFFSGIRAGTWTATAQAAGLAPGSQEQRVIPGPPVRLGFFTPPRAALAGDCSVAVSVGFTDAFGNAAPVASDRPLGFVASPPTGFELFSDALCAIRVTTATVLASAPAVELFFKGTRAGQVTLTAMTSGMAPANQVQTVRPRIPERLVFLTPERSPMAGTCSALLTVQAQDGLANPVAVEQATPMALESPGTDASFFSDGSCAVPLAAPALPAGHDSLGFYLRATAAGLAEVVAAAFGASASQPLTVQPGATARLSFDPLESPQARHGPFTVVLRAQDAYANPTPAFAEPMGLVLAPAGPLACVSECSDPATTSAPSEGIWRGLVSVGAAGAGKRLVAFAGALSASSEPLEVLQGPARSAPLARLSFRSAAVAVGELARADAFASFDHQSESLETSFDFSGSSGEAPFPGSPWSGSPSASASFSAPGLFLARLAVRDGDGEVGYGEAAALAVAAADLCVVTTAAPIDDGASACDGAPGPDGALSLDEAVRLINGSPGGKTIAFAGPMELAGGTLALTGAARIAGGRGVVLRRALSIGADLTLVGLEVAGTTTPSVVLAGAALTAHDLHWHDAAGLTVRGAATLRRARFHGCRGDCVIDDGGSALSISFSELRGAPDASGLSLDRCAVGAGAVEIRSTVFAGLRRGIRARCDRPLTVAHATFDSNDWGLEYAGGSGHLLENAVFTRQRVSAAACGSAAFASRRFSLGFGNSADGCLAGDAGWLAADPGYVLPAARDWRLQSSSPAVDSAADLGGDVNGAAPGRFLGAGPDRGGLESN